MITREEAKQLQITFGPCTTLYECMTIDEILEDANGEDGETNNIFEYAWLQYDLESVHLDRAMFACENDRQRTELGAFLAELNQRVREVYGPDNRSITNQGE